MAIFIFYLLWAAFTALPIILFDLTDELRVITVLSSVGFIVLGAVLAFLVFVIHLAMFGRFQKNASALDVKHHKRIAPTIDLALHLLRLKIKVTGLDTVPKEPFIYVGNHQTNYDILAIKSLLRNYPMVFIAKYTLFNWPLVGRLATFLGNIPIHRESDRAAAQAIIKGIKAYNEGHVVAIFPEGKRTFSNTMIDFKAGAFKLATKPQAPLVVGTMYDIHKVWKGWPFKRHVVRIHFHRPLYPSDYGALNTQELSGLVKTMINEQLKTFEERT